MNQNKCSKISNINFHIHRIFNTFINQYEKKSNISQLKVKFFKALINKYIIKDHKVIISTISLLNNKYSNNLFNNSNLSKLENPHQRLMLINNNKIIRLNLLRISAVRKEYYKKITNRNQLIVN
jgi:hypothetical protein